MLTIATRRLGRVNPADNIDPSLVSLVADVSSIASDGVEEATFTVTALDRNGLAVVGATAVPAATGSGNTLSSPAVTNSQGITTFTFKTTGAATHTVSIRVNGIAVTQTVDIVAASLGGVDVSTSTVSCSSSVIEGDSTTITLQAKDSNGINITTGGETVVFGHSGGTADVSIGAVTDNDDGTYTATLTANAAGTATTLTATINGDTVTTTMPAVTVTSASGFAFDPASNGFINVINRDYLTKASSGSDRGSSGRFPDRLGGSEGYDAPGSNGEVSDADFSISGGVASIRFAVGQTANNGPCNILTQSFAGSAYNQAATQQVAHPGPYAATSYYLRRKGYQLSSGANCGVPGMKMLFIDGKNVGGKAMQPYIPIYDNGNGTFILGVNFQGTPDNSRSWTGDSGVVVGQVTAGSQSSVVKAAAGTPGAAIAADDTAYNIEILLQMNTVYTNPVLNRNAGTPNPRSDAGFDTPADTGAAGDGVFKLWVNGTLCVHVTTVNYMASNAAGHTFIGFRWNPTYGFGTGPSGANATEFFTRVDREEHWVLV